MKKLLYCAAALATLLFAGSCQRENLEPAQENSMVTFTIEVPAAIQTKAIADGSNVDQLVYEVWLTETLGDLNNGQLLYHSTVDNAFTDGKANLPLDLVNNQNFTVLFWAQNAAAAAYDADDLTAVTYAKTSYLANNDDLAAFYAVAYVADTKHVKKDGTATSGEVKLTRPFAQLNLGTLNVVKDFTVKLVSSTVTVDKAPTKFNVATSETSEEKSFTFADANVPAGELEVNGTKYQYVAMNYLFAGSNLTVDYTIKAELIPDGATTGTVSEITNQVKNVPVDENYRTNIIGNLLTSKTDYEIVIDAAFAGTNVHDAHTDYVTNDTDLLAALTANKKEIIIDLAQKVVTKATTPKTYNLDVTAWKTLAFGGDLTKSITINANGNTINFNLKNSDWSHVALNNDDAVLVINNAKITTSGYNTDHWKRTILHFASDVILNDVEATGLGFKKDAELNNVSIAQTGDNYALWIWAQGQDVKLNGVDVVSEGRAIKIADEDASGPEKVTLDVANSSFASVKKAAVLVTSTAGAEINWGKGNDITGVSADPINAVWVDEDRAQYASEVKVNGATVAVEGQAEVNFIDTTEELVAALKAGESYILLEPGNYELAQPEIVATNVIVQGRDRENCVIKLTKQIRAKDGVTALTFKNLTIDVPTGLNYTEHDFAWIHYLKEFNLVDCNSNGRIRLNCHSANIEGRNFDVTVSSGFDGYAIQYQGATASNTRVKHCTFNTAGKAIVMYNEGKMVLNMDVEDCTFASSDDATDKAAVQMHAEYGISGTLDITNCTVTGFADVNGGLWNELNNNTKVPTYNFTITVDGATVQEAGYEKVSDGVYKKGVNYNVSNAAGLAYMNTIFANKSAGRDVVLKLTSDIDFSGYTWTPVDSHADTAFEIAEINGNGHTISNFTVNGQAMFKRFAGSGDVVIKDITFDNATVNSTAINTSILTVQTYQNVLLDNVDVKNSTITGGYKVAPLLATVYNESSSTVTATLKNCDVENVTVKATSYDFCTAGMVAFVYADDNDKAVFENCTVKDVKLIAPDDGYKAHAAVYTTGSDSLYNEAEGVTVTNVTFEAL